MPTDTIDAADEPLVSDERLDAEPAPSRARRGKTQLAAGKLHELRATRLQPGDYRRQRQEKNSSPPNTSRPASRLSGRWPPSTRGRSRSCWPAATWMPSRNAAAARWSISCGHSTPRAEGCDRAQDKLLDVVTRERNTTARQISQNATQHDLCSAPLARTDLLDAIKLAGSAAEWAETRLRAATQRMDKNPHRLNQLELDAARQAQGRARRG